MQKQLHLTQLRFHDSELDASVRYPGAFFHKKAGTYRKIS